MDDDDLFKESVPTSIPAIVNTKNNDDLMGGDLMGFSLGPSPVVPVTQPIKTNNNDDIFNFLDLGGSSVPTNTTTQPVNNGMNFLGF
jgi:hypothetical protein